MRVQRDIPAGLIVAGVDKSNLRQLVQQKLAEQNDRCACIRCREVGHRTAVDNVTPNLDNIKIEEIYSSQSFAIVLTKGIQRKDSLPYQLGFTLLCPFGKWLFNDTDWITPENRQDFIDGFKNNFHENEELASELSYQETELLCNNCNYNLIGRSKWEQFLVIE